MTERGAALLEVLIALALTAMMAAALSAVTGFGLSSVERAQSGSTRMTAEILERRGLTETLSRLTLWPGQPSLIGSAETMTWRTMTPGADVSSVPTIMRLRARDMEMAICAEMAATACAAFAEGGDRSARLSYAGPDGIWRAEWAETAPPALVRIITPETTIITAPRITGGQR